MTDDRKGGIALITGTLALLVTMALHPTGHELLGSGEQFHRVALLGVVAHTLAELALPILFLGALALTRRLWSPDRSAIAALVLYGVALIAGMVAAAVSGFVAPALARQIIAATPAAKATWEAIFAYNGAINQAFARIMAVGSSAALTLWSVAMWKTRAMARGLAIYGLVAGIVLIAVVAPGFLKLNVHGFGLVVIIQGVWFIAVGTAMVRGDAHEG